MRYAKPVGERDGFRAVMYASMLPAALTPRAEAAKKATRAKKKEDALAEMDEATPRTLKKHKSWGMLRKAVRKAGDKAREAVLGDAYNLASWASLEPGERGAGSAASRACVTGAGARGAARAAWRRASSVRDFGWKLECQGSKL